MASWSIWDKLFMPLQSVSHLTQILHEWLKQCFLVICFSSLYGELVVKWILQEHCKCLGWNIGLGEIKQQQANVSVCNFVFQDMMMREKELEYFREWEKQEDSVRFTDHTHFCVLPFPVCLNLICVQAHTRMHMHTHAPTHAHIHTYIHTHSLTHSLFLSLWISSAHTRACMNIHTHTDTYIHRSILIFLLCFFFLSVEPHLHILKHAQAQALSFSFLFSVPLNRICTLMHATLSIFPLQSNIIHTLE